MKIIDDATADWRTRAVQPLRALRRDLKNGVSCMGAQASEALRNDIKRCELHAERLQQEMLERMFPVATTGVASAIQEAATANLAAYSTMISTTSGALPEDLAQNLLKLFGEEFANELTTQRRA